MLAFLDKSADAREGQILDTEYEPIFDGIRSDPRFGGLEKRVGLERYPHFTVDQNAYS